MIGKSGTAFAALLATTLMLAGEAEARQGGGNSGSSTRYTCRASGAGDISMQARWEVKGTRKRFRVEFEAASGGSYVAGQTMVVAVGPTGATVDVASAQLETIGADVVFEIGFDSRASGKGDNVAFPPNFPTVGQGSEVAVKTGGSPVLACTLR